ncbi:hypothetical protein IQ266_12005 [filamentous cyanobacterium LEGE 11480]|uniref:Uncharacterized protein n=1 Tax=Romeriopsis navalis LEGE 11480 TaxID=2777977 RepID=A0A928Z3A4_9CYAN|nr:hypothetical protein [Romeriopsis navalis]MBE9030454.1 hypothetical protein [Romeriopsis navalis LEGE 11480]
MPHLSITTYSLLAHNGEVHRKPRMETSPSSESNAAQQTTGSTSPMSTAQIAPNPSNQFLGEALFLLIIVVPILLFQIRRQRFQ